MKRLTAFEGNGMRRNLCILVVLILFLVGILPTLLIPSHSNTEDAFETYQSNHTLWNPIDDSTTILSDDQKTGIIEPLVVEQRGYVSTGTASVRNDLTLNIEDSLPIDATHSWIGSVASAEIYDLEKLYALNGTFDDGVPGVNVNPNGSVVYYPLGWTSNSTNTGTYPYDILKSSYYSSDSQYVQVESVGGKVGQDSYGHAAGNSVVWTQIIQNSPYTEDFVLNFDYLYLRGPLDGPTGTELIGNCSLALFIDGLNVWNMSLLLLSQKEVWYNTGNIPIHFNEVPSVFTLGIGLIINESLVLDYVHDDYDGDGYIDDIEDCAYITAYLDDVSFMALTPPTPESIEMTFNAGAGFATIAGTSGSGTAAVSNSSYWDADTLDISFTSNTTISFTYDVSLLCHRFSNSTWTNEISSEGSAYQIVCGGISQVETFAYIGSAAEYTNNSLTLGFPCDWDNITVYDPFLTDSTKDCLVQTNNVTIPDSLFSRLGWWRFVADTPNYVNNLQTQISGPSTLDWTNETIFRSTNYSRVTLEIGTDMQEPSSLSDVELFWYMPNGTLWFSEIVNSMSGNILNSSFLTFGYDNTTAGLWNVTVFWENGTELAFDVMNFEIHHQAQLIAENVMIETNVGTIITNMVRYVDIETMAYIMDAGSDIVANWSASVITFLPNPVHNWWEANFNTSLIGGGYYSVRVNASGTYYDDASTMFEIRIILTDNELSLSQNTA
ncbi:MAG: hypothetical protein P1Q69_14040 [Candidatus Thorarchaeota archaeon]|nr:hypothetical protein [Candidatus Thorarchaeota archaeon]